jgi:sulfonate transport system permease protein
LSEARTIALSEQGRGSAARAATVMRASRTGYAFVLPALLLVVWQGVAQFGWVQPNLLPSPAAVAREAYDLALSGELTLHIGATAWRVAVGFLLGTVCATLLGALTGYSTRAQALLDPTLQALKAVPSLAWVPLFILWFGIFETSKVLLIAAGTFFPVYLNLMSGIRDVDRKLFEVARIFNLSEVATVVRVLLPATLPAYIVGVRGGLALAWMFVIAAELMGAAEGIGFLMLDGQMTGRATAIIASLLLFAICGKLTDAALMAAARPFLGWQDNFGRDR